MQRFFSSKWLVIGCITAALFALNADGNAAGFVPAKKDKATLVQETVQQIQLYVKAEKAAYTLAGFESFVGRKLSNKEKRIFKVYRVFIDPTLSPEEDAAMKRNKRLGNISLILGLSAFALIFIPYISILGLLAFPAAVVTGIIAISRAQRYNSRKDSGFGSGLAGLIIGGLGILSFMMLILLVVLSL